MGKKVLVTPLNWGLGHATRCVPIVRLLLQRGHEVLIASDGDSLMLLKKEFPALAFFELPSYNIQYSRNIPAWLFTLWRTPKFLKSIRREHAVVEKLIHENLIELIVSDNRYGCRSKNVQSVFMSHQLNLIMPSGMKWMGGIINFFHSRLIKKFNAIWVPDAQNSVLSGELSRSNLRVEFVGVLSRFEKSIEIQQVNKLVVVLSGPEPQRTLLEKNLLPQVIALNLPSIFVRGLLNEKMGESEIDQVKIVNYLKSDTLQNVMEQSEIIISRSGYSTIMDLAVLKKKAILIPTPGQPEQEYLASKYMNDRIAYSTDQEVLDLADALELSTEYLGFEHKASDELLLKAFDKVGL
jgi:UDP:flavonoid glycosyltransferase YjiC (YdhE family)